MICHFKNHAGKYAKINKFMHTKSMSQFVIDLLFVALVLSSIRIVIIESRLKSIYIVVGIVINFYN